MTQPRRINLDEQAKELSCTTIILADGAVTAPKLAAGAITGNAIAPGTIGASKFNASVFGNGLVYNNINDAIDVNVDNTTLHIVSDTIKLKSVILENLSSAPAAGTPGRLIWRTDIQQVQVDTGSSLVPISGGGGGSFPLLAPDGSTNAPSYSFASHPLTGFFNPSNSITATVKSAATFGSGSITINDWTQLPGHSLQAATLTFDVTNSAGFYSGAPGDWDAIQDYINFPPSGDQDVFRLLDSNTSYAGGYAHPSVLFDASGTNAQTAQNLVNAINLAHINDPGNVPVTASLSGSVTVTLTWVPAGKVPAASYRNYNGSQGHSATSLNSGQNHFQPEFPVPGHPATWMSGDDQTYVIVAGHKLIEGIDWVASTDNNTTAASLGAAMSALSEVSVSVVGNTVNYTATTAGVAGNINPSTTPFFVTTPISISDTPGVDQSGTDVLDINVSGIYMFNGTVTNLAEPVNSQDAATKNYVDTHSANPGGNVNDIQTNNGSGGLAGSDNFTYDGVRLVIKQNPNVDPFNTASYALAITGSGGSELITIGSDDTNAYIQSWQNSPLIINSLGNEVRILPTGGYNLVIGANQILSVDGSVSNPMYSFSSDRNSGMYYAGSAAVGFATNGVARLVIGNTSLQASVTVDANSNAVINVLDPVNAQDAATKNYVDNHSSVSHYAKDLLTVSSPSLDHTINLSNTPVADSEIVSLNGLVLRVGSGNDYTISGNVLTINPGVVLTVGDEFMIVYAY